MQTRAHYFDGQNAGSKQGTLQASPAHIQFSAEGISVDIVPHDLRIEAPVGSGRWRIILVDNASIEFADESFGQYVEQCAGKERSIAGLLEKSWRAALGALVVAIVGAWLLLTFGVPIGAKYVAFSIPADVDQTISDESIEIMDSFLFATSKLDESEQAHIQKLFSDITSQHADYDTYRLEFRASDIIGANAFAVPGGLVIMTDQMVDLADSDAEIIGVLAHEVGHLAQRHSLRIILQNSSSAIIIAGLTGDLTNITALSAAIPTFLMQSKYSRDFEREADEFSFAYLRSIGVDTNVLADLLTRLEEDQGEAGEIPGWLSSHPQSEERRPSQMETGHAE